MTGIITVFFSLSTLGLHLPHLICHPMFICVDRITSYYTTFKLNISYKIFPYRH